MKEFLQVLRRFVPPYKKYLVLTVVFNILSAVLNIFSFMAIIPILQILFKTQAASVPAGLMDWGSGNMKDVLINNANYYIYEMIGSMGATTTLLVIGLFLAFMTFLKTGAYFLSSATIIPIRTGVVRDIRNQLYRKITSLPLGFFSEERKGDIIARMSGDVQEIENSIMSSLDMLFKNPILIVFYFATLLVISWQLTLFTLVIVPIMGWFMGFVGRKLKQKSIKAQSLWSDTMSQVEETLGGLRIIKAFCAEEKMNRRFDKINSEYRENIRRVNTRQQMAHPMSEFLGTVMIVIVLWFGGVLVLNNMTLSGPTFIYYLVILYSIINPLKEFSKAGYNIPKGLASMERVDKILMAESNIKEPEHPVHITDFKSKIEFRNVSFKYDQKWVLRNINLTIEKGKTVALVGQSGGGGLVDDTLDVEAGDLAGVLRRLALRVGEVGRHGDDGFGHGLAKVSFCVSLQLLQDHGADLLRGVLLAVDLYFIIRAHLALDRADRAVRVRDGLTLCHLADHTLAGLGERDDGRGGAMTFRVGDNGRFAALHDGDAAIGSAKVDTDNFTHNDFLLY